MHEEQRTLLVAVQRGSTSSKSIGRIICLCALTSAWSAAAAVTQDTAHIPRFEIGAEASYALLERGVITVDSWGAAVRFGVRLRAAGHTALQLHVAHAPMRQDPFTPGLTSLEIDLVQSLLPVQRVKRHANVFGSIGVGALATDVQYPVSQVDCLPSPSCGYGVTKYDGGIEALLVVGAGVELGIIPQLPLTARAQLVFTLGAQEPGAYLRIGLGAIWRIG